MQNLLLSLPYQKKSAPSVHHCVPLYLNLNSVDTTPKKRKKQELAPMADGHGNWDDLYSIVRSCSPNKTKNNTNQVITQKSPQDKNLVVHLRQESVDTFPLHNSLSFEDGHGKNQSLSCLHELQDSYKPFLPSNYYINPDKNISSTNQNIPSTITYNSCFQGQPPPLMEQQPQLTPLPATSNNNIEFGPPRLENNIGIQHHPAQVGHQLPKSRKKSRSRQKKRVVELPADDLSSDVWAWRKYGQKPIKGSPFPRSYYKCSSSRGCPARKQVERRSDNSDLFIVSYSGDHKHPPPSHRNSLAGISRLKLSTSAVSSGAYNVNKNNHHPGDENAAADATSADSQSTNQKDLGQMFNI